MTDVLTYDSFTPGTELGDWQEPVDAGLIATWDSLFGASEQDQPARQTGLCIALMMRAFLKVVTPRPPGNIHARQLMTIENLPQAGDSVHSKIRCIDKQIKRGRRYLDLEVTGYDANQRPLYVGKMSLIWAQ
ncbi:MAG TPA: hypothetical protein VKZ94_14885 [Advenella sp.]|nr:hypothetical protein [Advenella sp.]